MNIINALSRFLRNLARVGVFAILSAGATLQTTAADNEVDYAQKLSRAHLFLQPLAWVGTNAPTAEESRDLYEAAGLDVDHKPTDRVGSMEGYISAYPNSPWIPSLRANLAAYYRTLGRYSVALEYWQKAWDATKDGSDSNSRKVADYTLAYWTDLLSSLGRIEKLQELIGAVNGRPLSTSDFQRRFNTACQSAAIMRGQPGESFRCGSVALFNVARTLEPKGNFSPIADLASPSTGFSLADLEALSDQYHLGLVAVRRTAGNELIVPSVIHWKENHYAALVEKIGSGYKVIDPTFGRPQWLSSEIINENTSGYFLIPTNQVPLHWQIVSLDQAKTVFGKGLHNAGSTQSKPHCDADGNPCTTGCTNECPPGQASGGNQPGGSGGPGGGGGPGTSGPGKMSCSSCTASGSGYMPDWKVEEPFISLWLHDRPLFYNRSIGGQSFLQMDYHQREEDGGRSAYSFGDFGPNWNCNLLTYILVQGNITNGTTITTTCDGSTNCTSDSEPLSGGGILATEYCPDGGQRVFGWSGSNSGPFIDVISHVRFVPAISNAAFENETRGAGGEEITSFGSVEHYMGNTLAYPNGSIATFNVLTISDFPEIRVGLLTSATDPHGHTMFYSYITNDDQILLSQVGDFDGKTNQFIYGNASFPTSITEVTNSYYHLGVNFTYDDGGRLTNIVDMAGISSSFGYMSTNELYYTNYDGSGHPVPLGTNSATLLTKLTTPYGTTTFDYFHPTWQLFGFSPDNNINRAITVTQPDGGKQLFVYQDNSDYSAGNYPSQRGSMPDDYANNYTIWNAYADNNEMMHDNSFYWGPRQYAALNSMVLTNLNSTDFISARMRNWLHAEIDDTLSVGQTVNVEQGFSPDNSTAGKAIWYGYEGKPGDAGNAYLESTNDGLPVSFGYTLDAGHDTAFFQNLTRNSNGFPAEVVEFGRSQSEDFGLRTNLYVYADNNFDLVAHIGADGVVQEGYAYDGNHSVIAMTNALREVTKYTYNLKEQLTSTTQPNNLVTTNIYGPDGFMATTYDYSGSTYYRTNSYTYTNGLVLTHTDERGLTTTNTWNALQKIARIDYPDGTSMIYTYSNLDLVRVVDRMKFTNSYAYDSMERGIAETNAIGNATIYNYCACGSLDSILDALGKTNSFYYDAAGRLTNTVYPDGLRLARGYNTAGMLINVTSSSGKSIDYSYDGLLRKVATSADIPGSTSPILEGHSYDVNDMVTVETNANGVVTSMTYDPLHRLASRTYPDSGVEHFGYTANIPGMTSYTNQLTNVWTYAYDPLNRKTNEVALGVYTNSFTYNLAGDLLTLVDGKSQATTWKYDLFGRVTNKLDSLGTNLFIYGYDADNRLTNRTSAAKGLTKYSYDPVGNLTFIDYPVSPDITLRYDAMNRLTNMVDAVGTTRYAYDAAGQILSEDGPWDNDTVSYTYANRLRTGLSLGAPNSSAWTQSYGYDLLDRLTSVTSPAGTFGYYFGYDFFTATFDPGSLIRRLSLPNGAYITNIYDSSARITGTYLRNSSDANLDTEDYVYNRGNQRTQQVFTAGNYVNYTYDSIGELKTALGKEAGGVTNRMQEQFGYIYDAVGNLNYRTNNTLLQQFNVNGLNELTTVTNGGKLTVAGATTGHATSVTVNSVNAILYANTSFASTNQSWANGNNTYTAVANDSYGRTDTDVKTVSLQQTNKCAYDLNGNMVTNGIRVLEYDDENQLIRITEPNTWKSEFTYDGKMRRRIRKESTWNGSAWLQTNEVRYIYDDKLAIQERDGNNLPQVTYTRGTDLSGKLQGAGGIGGLLARTSMGMWIGGSGLAHAFYHADGSGNIIALIYTNQSIAAKYEYDPYGNTLTKIGPLTDANVYQFSSKEYHPASGSIYYLLRYYDPSLQRWLNRDPLGESGFERLRRGHVNLLGDGPNFYSYVQNNPANRTDPLGLDGELTLAAEPTLMMTPEEIAEARAAALAKARAAALAAEACEKIAKERKRRQRCNDIWTAQDAVCDQYYTPEARTKCHDANLKELHDCLRNKGGVYDN